MAQTGVIIPMPPQPVDPTLKENLGSQVSAIMQTYNDMKQSLMEQSDNPTKAQLNTLLEQRRAAVEAIFAAHRATLDSLFGVGHAKLSGLATSELETIQAQLTAEQGKLSALSAYFDQYKIAVAAGNTPPALPPELSGSTLGISSTTLAIIAAIAAGAWFWWSGKE
jgi:hypothetical protein